MKKYFVPLLVASQLLSTFGSASVSLTSDESKNSYENHDSSSSLGGDSLSGGNSWTGETSSDGSSSGSYSGPSSPDENLQKMRFHSQEHGKKLYILMKRNEEKHTFSFERCIYDDQHCEEFGKEFYDQNYLQQELEKLTDKSSYIGAATRVLFGTAMGVGAAYTTINAPRYSLLYDGSTAFIFFASAGGIAMPILGTTILASTFFLTREPKKTLLSLLKGGELAFQSILASDSSMCRVYLSNLLENKISQIYAGIGAAVGLLQPGILNVFGLVYLTPEQKTLYSVVNAKTNDLWIPIPQHIDRLVDLVKKIP